MRVPAVPIEDLLAQEDFVRRLARSLLCDEHAVDDVVQQTWLKAMLCPPRHRQAPHRWLKSVVWRSVRDQRRADRSRMQREAAVARPEATPSPAEIRAREALRQEVVDALLALPPRYRDVLVLRFFTGLSPKAIAARLGHPGATVRSNLRRGLQRIRDHMERHDADDRTAWIGALNLLAGRPTVAASSAVGATATLSPALGLTMMKKGLCIGATILVIAGGIWFSAASMGAAIVDPVSRRGAVGGSFPSHPTAVAHQRVQIASDSITTTPPHAYTGRLRQADRAAAAGIRYLVVEDDFRVRQTFAAAEHWITFPGDCPRTDATGFFNIAADAPTRGYLWFELRSQHKVAFDLRDRPSGCELVLPEPTELRVSISGIEADEPFRFVDQPAIHTVGKGWCVAGCTLVVVDAPGLGPVFHLLGMTQILGKGPSELVLPAVAGVHYEPFVGSSRFRPPELGVLPAPFALDVRSRDPIDHFEVTVLGRDGHPDPGSGLVSVLPSSSWGDASPCRAIERGHASVSSFGHSDWTALSAFEIRVVMADGERFSRQTNPTELRSQPHVHFARGSGESPTQLRLQDPSRLFPDSDERRTGTPAGTLWLETKSRSLVRGDWWTGREGWPGNFFVIAAGEELRVVDAPADWRVAWLVMQSGDVAKADRTAGETELRWLPTRLLPDLDLAAIFRKWLPGQAAVVRYRLALVDDDSTNVWTVVDSFEVVPPRSNDAHGSHMKSNPPFWRKRGPIGMPHEIELRALDSNARHLLHSGH